MGILLVMHKSASYAFAIRAFILEVQVIKYSLRPHIVPIYRKCESKVVDPIIILGMRQT